MSFAATAALVGAFAALRGWPTGMAVPGWAKGAFAVVVSSVVAGAATAPFAAAHFNQIATYGLIANLLSVPVMGSIIMPGAVIAALLTLIGLAAPIWAVLEWGLIWILAVAEVIAAWPGAVRPVQTPPDWMLGAVTLAAIWVLLWQGPLRWLGVLPLAMALGLWNSAARPAILIADTGGLVGVMADGARALSRARGDGFVAGVWLENDGDRADQATAAARPLWQAEGNGMAAQIDGLRLWHGPGQRALAQAQSACANYDIVILGHPAPAALAHARVDLAPPYHAGQAQLPLSDAHCLLFDGSSLARSGALVLTPAEGAVIGTSAAVATFSSEFIKRKLAIMTARELSSKKKSRKARAKANKALASVSTSASGGQGSSKKVEEDSSWEKVAKGGKGAVERTMSTSSSGAPLSTTGRTKAGFALLGKGH